MTAQAMEILLLNYRRMNGVVKQNGWMNGLLGCDLAPVPGADASADDRNGDRRDPEKMLA